jgi:hypothetical protein
MVGSMLCFILLSATFSKPILAGDDSNNAPSIDITDPGPGSTFVTSSIIVNGTTAASDPANPVKVVEVFVHGYPFNGKFNYETAKQKINGNWSNWSFPVFIGYPGYYRIVAHVIDNTGRDNSTEVTINVPFIASHDHQSYNKKKIALVDNKFTDAAYGPNAFYFFYAKHKNTAPGVEVKSDLNMLTAEIPDVPEPSLNSTLNASDISYLVDPSDTEKRHLLPVAREVQKLIPDSIVTIIRDEDIHNGRIFTSNGSNAFDILILFHQEYMTQTGYDNLRHFVASGGKIVFMTGNIFYAQVDYDKTKRTVTLLKGHDWEFNGTSAKRSVGERWFNENREWVGSNFLLSEITDRIVFENNPFNYTHFEENFVSNPNAKIIYNYGVKLPNDNPYRGAIVASYELEYGKGNIVMLGLYSKNLVFNKVFMQFFDKIMTRYVI